MSNAAAIIEKVMGQKPRTGAWLPGARTREPWASVDDMTQRHTMFLHANSEDEALEVLLDHVRQRYPLMTQRAEMECA